VGAALLVLSPFLCPFLLTIALFRPFAACFADLSPVFVRSLLAFVVLPSFCTSCSFPPLLCFSRLLYSDATDPTSSV
jgi:glycopeptide antibiotics resistance protein